MTPRRLIRWWHLSAVVALCSVLLLTGAGTAASGAASKAPRTVAVAGAGACFGASYPHTSPAQDLLAVTSFGAYFSPCDPSGVWTFTANIAHAWNPATQLTSFRINILETTNAVVSVTVDGNLMATAVPQPAPPCGTPTAAKSGNALVVSVPLCVMHATDELKWAVFLTPASGNGPMDSMGPITESGYIVPGPAVCSGANGAGQSGRQVLTTARPREAVSVLRTAGATAVADHGQGVLTFVGDAVQVRRRLASAGVTASVAPEHVRHLADVPNDPKYPAQWNLPMVNAPAGWSVTHGSGSIFVADIDTGVDFTHPDLSDNLVVGYDAVRNTPIAAGNVTDNPVPGEAIHGTEVASVIGATTNNGGGMASAGWSTRVMPIKVDDASQGGGILSGPVAAGIRWAADHGARVINMSLGGPCPDAAEQAAVQYAQSKGLLVVASAGNDAQSCAVNPSNCGNPSEFPAAYPGVLAVGGVGRDGTHAFYSNAGPYLGLVAPSGSADGHPADDMVVAEPGGSYSTSAGTSFASPMVAAAAALVMAADPALNAAAVSARLLATAKPPPGVDPSQPLGTNEYGHGLLDMGAALAGLPATPPPPGLSRYWLAARDGGIFAFGTAGFFGSTGAMHLNQPVVGLAGTPDGGGYWLAASDGGIFTFGDARFFGSAGAIRLNRPIVGMGATPTGGGYWLVASDGGIFAFGDAVFLGSTGAIQLNRPIVSMAATPTGRGYWLVASDGGIFSFGDATFFGSTGSISLNRPIVGMAASPTGKGYWLVASDGGIFSFGDATFFGSAGAIQLNQPIVGMAATPTGKGYWLVASDGGIFAFGDASFLGSTGALHLTQPVVGLS